MKFIQLKEVPLDIFRMFLLQRGYCFGSIPGGHEKWCKEGVLRPVVLRMNADPVPAYFVMNALRGMEVEVSELLEFLERDCYGIKNGPDIPAHS